MSFLYNNLSQDLPELDVFNKIILSLYTVAWPASKDEYKDYNL